MTKTMNTNSVEATVTVCDLQIDPAVQRELNKAWVNLHAKSFDPDKIGRILVNVRKDGKMYVIDGQHRTALLMLLGYGQQRIRVEMFRHLDIQQEAALFLARNDRRSVQKADLFRIAVQAGETAPTAIDKIVRESGLIVDKQCRDGRIGAIDKLERIYAGLKGGEPGSGEKALRRTINTLLGAFGDQAVAFRGELIHGLGMVYLRYADELDDAALTHKLSTFKGGAGGLVGSARSLTGLTGRALFHSVAELIVDLYNKQRRTGRIADWFMPS